MGEQASETVLSEIEQVTTEQPFNVLDVYSTYSCRKQIYFKHETI